MDTFDMLNTIYKPLCDRSAEISRGLRHAGYQVKVQFHNNHSVKRNNDFAIEYFPIPIIFIEKLGSIGVDIDSIWFEAILTKEQAIAFDYAKIINRYRLEIYGIDHYLCDIYNERMDASKIVSSISNGPEMNICILFYLRTDVSCDELVEIAQLLAA